jgi:pilus assembly protein CpaB
VQVLAVDQLADPTNEKPMVVKAVTLEVDETGGQKLALASSVGTLALLLRKAGETADDAPRQLSTADLGRVARQTGDARFVTILVTRSGKDATTHDEVNVPVERGDARAAAVPVREMAHD